jgi:hypothetical protein
MLLRAVINHKMQLDAGQGIGDASPEVPAGQSTAKINLNLGSTFSQR